MVNAVSTTTDTTAAAAAMKKSIGMNKDDFLKLFITQLQNQDPLKPQDPEQMVSQLAQLTQVEQAYNTTAGLEKLLSAQNDAMTMSSVSFIGKNLLANGNDLAFDGSNPAKLQFSLPQATASTTITVSDASGRPIVASKLGPLAAGGAAFTWDGRGANGEVVPAGAYRFTVTGTTANGTDIAATTYTTGRIDGITIDNGKPMLTLGAVKVPMSSVISVKGA